MFWNNQCKNLSERIWIPSLIDKNQFHRDEDFRCNNKNILCNYYHSPEPINIDDVIEFNELPIVDNDYEKKKLRTKLVKRENTRMNKEISKYNSQQKTKKSLQ